MHKATLLALCGLLCVALASQYSQFHHIQGRHGAPASWKFDSIPHSDHNIDFSINLRQCNVDVLTQTLLSVSDPDSPAYGKYLSAQELDEMLSCGNDKERVIEWLRVHNINNFKIVSNSIRVSAPVSVVERLLQTTFHRFSHEKHGMVVRQVGTVSVPAEVKECITFITGISEFFHDSKFEPVKISSSFEKMERINSFLKAQGVALDDFDPNAEALTDPLIHHRRLRHLYKIPTFQKINSPDNTMGIAAFTDAYDESALCTFIDWNNLETYPVTWIGPRDAQDEVESDLDVQYATAVTGGIALTFHNHGEGGWILDWAQEAVDGTTASGPWVWSLSYGWPEVAHCEVVDNVTIMNCPTGYDYNQYIQATDIQLAKLGTMGVTVVVSSGDDGTPGFSPNCPVDPNYPVGQEKCSDWFDDGECQCAGMTLTAVTATQTYICNIPNGLVGLQDDCFQILNNQVDGGVCTELVEEVASNSNWNSDGTCPFVLGTSSFWSTCTCDLLQPVSKTSGSTTCTVSGFKYDASSGPVFFADYPTSSPWVTSVGATALQWNFESCGNSEDLPEIYANAIEVAGFSGGGGFSNVHTMPDYQFAAVQKYLKNYQNSMPPSFTFNSGNRAYPDVSLNGHNFMVQVGMITSYQGLNGAIFGVGGTSASSPSFGGIIALLNDIQFANNRRPLGFINPLLYKLASSNPKAFNDIVPQTQNLNGTLFVEGADTSCTQNMCCQYGFPVTAGWDAGTGLGTINFMEFQNALNQIFEAKEQANKVNIN